MQINLNNVIEGQSSYIFRIGNYIIFGKLWKSTVSEVNVIQNHDLPTLQNLIRKALDSEKRYAFKGKGNEAIPSGDLTEYSDGALLYFGRTENNHYLHVGVNKEDRGNDRRVDLVAIYRGNNFFSTYLVNDDIELFLGDIPELSPYDFSFSFMNGDTHYLISEGGNYIKIIQSNGDEVEYAYTNGSLTECKVYRDTFSNKFVRDADSCESYNDIENIVDYLGSFDVPVRATFINDNPVSEYQVKEYLFKEILFKNSGKDSFTYRLDDFIEIVEFESYPDLGLVLITGHNKSLPSLMYQQTTLMPPEPQEIFDAFKGREIIVKGEGTEEKTKLINLEVLMYSKVFNSDTLYLIDANTNETLASLSKIVHPEYYYTVLIDRDTRAVYKLV